MLEIKSRHLTSGGPMSLLLIVLYLPTLLKFQRIKLPQLIIEKLIDVLYIYPQKSLWQMISSTIIVLILAHYTIYVNL